MAHAGNTTRTFCAHAAWFAACCVCKFFHLDTPAALLFSETAAAEREWEFERWGEIGVAGELTRMDKIEWLTHPGRAG